LVVVVLLKLSLLANLSLFIVNSVISATLCRVQLPISLSKRKEIAPSSPIQWKVSELETLIFTSLSVALFLSASPSIQVAHSSSKTLVLELHRLAKMKT
jgi:hypothetical protein